MKKSRIRIFLSVVVSAEILMSSSASANGLLPATANQITPAVMPSLPETISATGIDSMQSIEAKISDIFKPEKKKAKLSETYSGTCGDNVNWNLDTSTGKLTISGSGPMTDFSGSSDAPWYSYYNFVKSITIGSGVTHIGRYAFWTQYYVTSVTIPNTVTSIGNSAFYWCSSLTSVTIPNSVTSIGVEAFLHCDKLTAINVDTENNNYKSINGVLFDKAGTTLIQYPCGKSGSYTVPSSVTSISSKAFQHCAALTSVVIPNSVVSIGSSAFSNCDGLVSVIIPNSVEVVDSQAFLNCEKLTTITVDSNNLNYKSMDGVLFNKVATTLIQYPGGKSGSYTVPNTVTIIGDYAFYNCYSLKSVTISNSVELIGNHAFSNCNSLGEVNIGNRVISIGANAFSSCDSLTSITIPDSVASISRQAFYSCSGLTSITIPSSVKSIESSALQNCDKLTTIIVDSNNLNYKSINGVLFNQAGTTLIQYPGGKAGSYSIPNFVTSIGNYAFYNCNGLTSVMIPNSIISLGLQIFYSCNNLTKVTYQGVNDPATLSKSVFGDTAVTAIDVPANYKDDLFCGMPVNKILPEVPSEKFTALGDYFASRPKQAVLCGIFQFLV